MGRSIWCAARSCAHLVFGAALVIMGSASPCRAQSFDASIGHCVDKGLDNEGWLYLDIRQPYGTCGAPEGVSFWIGYEKRAEWVDASRPDLTLGSDRCFAVHIPEDMRPPSILVSAPRCEARIQTIERWRECKTSNSPCSYELVAAGRPTTAAPFACSCRFGGRGDTSSTTATILLTMVSLCVLRWRRHRTQRG